MIYGVLKRVFSQPWYLGLALLVAVLVISGLLLFPHGSLISQVWSSEAVLWSKISFVLSLYGTIATKFHWWGIVNILAVSLLFGINIALLTHYIRRRQDKVGSTGLSLASAGGFVSSLFGIGCASCGSVIATALLGLFGASGLLMFLPFHGSEFSILGLVLLLISIYYLIKKINDPLVCRMSKKDLRALSVK